MFNQVTSIFRISVYGVVLVTLVFNSTFGSAWAEESIFLVPTVEEEILPGTVPSPEPSSAPSLEPKLEKELSDRLDQPWLGSLGTAEFPPVPLEESHRQSLMALVTLDPLSLALWNATKQSIQSALSRSEEDWTDEKLMNIVSVCPRRPNGTIQRNANSKQRGSHFSICLPENETLSTAYVLLIHELKHIHSYASERGGPLAYREDFRDFEDFAYRDLLGPKGEVDGYIAQYQAQIRLERMRGNPTPRAPLSSRFESRFNDYGEFIGERRDLAEMLLNSFQPGPDQVPYYRRQLLAEYERLPLRFL